MCISVKGPEIHKTRAGVLQNKITAGGEVVIGTREIRGRDEGVKGMERKGGRERGGGREGGS